MATSYNGWPASPTLKTRKITPVPGHGVQVVDNPNVAVIFTYYMQQYHKRIEPIRMVGGFNYRPDVNDPSVLSCHASGTAIDINWDRHPNGAINTFTPAQMRELTKILAELNGTVQNGAFFHHTKDPMHAEINVAPGHLQATGKKLRQMGVKVR